MRPGESAEGIDRTAGGCPGQRRWRRQRPGDAACRQRCRASQRSPKKLVEQPEGEGQADAQENRSQQWRVELEAWPCDADIAGQASKPAQLVSSEPQPEANDDQHGTNTNKHFSEMFHGHALSCKRLSVLLPLLFEPCSSRMALWSPTCQDRPEDSLGPGDNAPENTPGMPTQIPVCRTCGERYYDRRTVRFLEEVDQKLKGGNARLRDSGNCLDERPPSGFSWP